MPGLHKSHRLFQLLSLVLVLSGCATSGGGAKSVDDYKAEAAAAVTAVDVNDAIAWLDDDDVVFIDVREADEIERLGAIDGSIHVPRGVLEFQVDPASGRHRDVFSSDKTIVFYCASGGRSMLAAKRALDMGVANPVYLDGGYAAYRDARGEDAQ